MRTTIPKTGNQSAHGSYGPRSHPPRVTGSRLNQRTVVKCGKRIGSKTSNECNSWLFTVLAHNDGEKQAASERPDLNTFIPTSTSKCQPNEHRQALDPEVCRDNWREQAIALIENWRTVSRQRVQLGML